MAVNTTTKLLTSTKVPARNFTTTAGKTQRTAGATSDTVSDVSLPPSAVQTGAAAAAQQSGSTSNRPDTDNDRVRKVLKSRAERAQDLKKDDSEERDRLAGEGALRERGYAGGGGAGSSSYGAYSYQEHPILRRSVCTHIVLLASFVVVICFGFLFLEFAWYCGCFVVRNLVFH